MAKLYNLAAMTVASTGTGPLTLGTAATISGVLYLAFATAGAVNGETIAYSINDIGASEQGTAVYSSVGPTITRTPVTSTNGNAPINVTTAAIVRISPARADIANLRENNTFTGVSNLFTGTMGVTGDFAVNTNKFTVVAASGNTVVAGTLDVAGNLTVNTNKFTVAAASGNTLVAGTLDVTGNLAINTNKFTVAAASGNTLVAGTLDAAGNFAVATNKFTVVAASGNTAIAGTLGLSGALTYGGVTLNNAVTGTGTMVLSASPTFTGTAAFASSTVSGTLAVTGATASTTPTTGALTVAGGLGVAGATNIGGNASVAGTLLVTGSAPLAAVGLASVATGAAVFGAPSLDNGFYFNTPSLNTGFSSGLGINGTWSSGTVTSTVNVYAYGVNSAGGYNSQLSIGVTLNAVAIEILHLSPTGVAVAGTISAPAKGHLFGTAGGTIASGAVAISDANVLLYNFSSTNWSGIGTDNNGNAWFKVGTVGAPVPAFWLAAADQSGHFTSAVASTSTTTGALTVAGGLGVVGAGFFGGAVNSASAFRSTSLPSTAEQLDVSGQAALVVANGGSAPLAASQTSYYFCFVTDGNSIIGQGAIYLLRGAGAVSSLALAGGYVAPTTTPAAGQISVAWSGTQFRLYNNGGGSGSFKYLLVKMV